MSLHPNFESSFYKILSVPRVSLDHIGFQVILNSNIHAMVLIVLCPYLLLVLRISLVKKQLFCHVFFSFFLSFVGIYHYLSNNFVSVYERMIV